MSDRAAVVAPGGGYGADGPLLMFSAVAARRRGATVRRLAWDFPLAGDPHAVVPAAVAAALDEEDYEAAVVFGKSLGSLAASVVAKRGLAAVWFTPLLTDPDVVAGLRRAEEPFLLAGGTADDYWDGRLARSLTPHVVQVEGADHGMFVPGGLAASAAVLGDVMTAVEGFLDGVAWPLS
jgi:hypothetical protein